MKQNITINLKEKNNKLIKIENFVTNLTEEQKIKFWIKTLLSSYSTFPEIIKTIDKIIELQASTVSFSSDVFNGSKSTYQQVERVIDLTERKNSLLNIYLVTQKMLKKVSPEDYDFLEKRFMYNWKIEELASELNVTMRTVYRKIEKLIDEIYQNLKLCNWTLKFIELQVKDEGWLKDRYKKQITDYFKNNNYEL